MEELKLSIHDEATGLNYVLVGDYYIPAIELPEGDDRLIGKWGRMHRAYLEETNPLLLYQYGAALKVMADCTPTLLIWTGRPKERCQVLVQQIAATEGVTEDLKRRSQWEWVRAMNSIVDRAEESIKRELIYT